LDKQGLIMIKTIRDLIARHGRLPVDVASLIDEQDLYAAGLTSFSAVQLMLGLEDAFDIEFPERMLNRKTFSSISAIAASIVEIAPSKAAA
jgi:acyl carrier protein